MVALPIVSVPGAVSITVSGRSFPRLERAAIVNGFSVEPGSKLSVERTVAHSLARARGCDCSGCSVGQLASARISPVCTSSMTSPPRFRLVRLRPPP